MDGYLQIYILITFFAAISGIVYGHKKRTSVYDSLIFAVIYYYALSLFRTLEDHGSEFLGQSFAGKNVVSYIKVSVFILTIGLIISIIRKIGLVDQIVKISVPVGVFFHITYSVCINIPTNNIIILEGLISIVIGTCFVLFKKNNCDIFLCTSVPTKNNYFVFHMLAWVMLCVIECPTETYANNQRDYMLSYTNFAPVLLFVGIIYLVTVWLINKYLFSGVLSTVISAFIFSYTFLNYIQSMFLNGHMNSLEGVEQGWNNNQIVLNLAIWTVVIALIIIFTLRFSKTASVLAYISGAIVALQLLALVSILFSNHLISDKKPYLTNDNMFELSSKENVVVFILDTYDAQMVDLVTDEDSAFLSPLNDFTYYDNMVSRFGYTDGSLPYLLTGILAEQYDSGYTYDESTFLEDIKSNNYDIRLYTETKYAEYFDSSIVDNLSRDSNMTIDFGKCVCQMLKCSRYRGMPYVFKSYYSYDGRDFDSIISDKNVVIFGNDEEFYDSMSTQQVSLGDKEGCFRLYHLYGAHSPYNFRESMTYDYSSNDPVAQWRACMEIVYEYINQLKKLGVYDNTTIIIMADHGPNVKQRTFLSELDITLSDDLHPIFFIKRRNEIHSSLITDNRATSHDVFQATVIEEIDNNNKKYGDAVWE